MEDSFFPGEVYAPVGRQHSALPISRRSFIGASVGTSGAAILLGAAEPAYGTSSQDSKQDGQPRSTLRFDEDRLGVTVTWYPVPWPEPSKELTKDQREEFERERRIADRARTWRLTRKAFGPSTKFLLRTLLQGNDKGYEVQVNGARFGRLGAANHWFVFQRDQKSETWRVRLRTQLWTPSVDGRAELTSEDVAFDLLAPLDPNTPRNSGEFRIATNSAAIGPALAGVFEDHLEIRSGPLQLSLSRDAVWKLGTLDKKSDSINAASKALTLAGRAFSMPFVEFAWCDPTPAKEAAENRQPPGRKVMKANDSDPDDPVFCAWSELLPRDAPLMLSPGRWPRVSVVAAPVPPPIPRETATTARPLSAKGEVAKTKADPTSAVAASPAASPASQSAVPPPAPSPGGGPKASVPPLADTASPTEPLSKPTPPRWIYTRHDWNVTGTSGSNHPAGISQIRASWVVHVAVQANRPEFGPICVREGVLQRTHGSQLRLRFAGRIDSTELTLPTRIGNLRVRGWTGDDADISPSTASALSHHPLMTITAVDFAAAVGSIDIPLLLLRSDLAPAGCDFSRLSFTSTALRAMYISGTAPARAALARADSYLWLGSPSALEDLPIAHIDLTRARLEVARFKDLARLAFMFAGLHLDIGSGWARITDDRRTCSVLRREVPGLHDEPAVLDTRPTLVVEFDPQHVFEEALFRPTGPKLPDVVVPGETFEVTWEKAGGENSPEGDVSSLPTQFSTAASRLLQQLGPLKPKERRFVRSEYARRKIAADSGFAAFSKKFEEEFRKVAARLGLPVEQSIYIGPEGMDADVAALANQVSRDTQTLVTEGRLKNMLDESDALMRLEMKEKPELTLTERLEEMARAVRDWITGQGETPSSLTKPALARLRERAVSSVIQDYGYFREFYAQQMILARFDQSLDPVAQPDAKFLADDLEFFSESNRKGLKISDGAKARQEAVLKRFVKLVHQKDPPDDVMRARLSGNSRLAFRVDCGTRPGIDVEDFASGKVSLRSDGKPEPAFGTFLAFSFDALTDWGRFDLAVTPRAVDELTFDDGGKLIRRESDSESGGGRDSGASDVAMLKALRIPSGKFITAQERLAAIESSLRVTPTSLETAIELPARLILSPSQKALWRTRRETVLWKRDADVSVPLWTAVLAIDGVNPLVRAVASPDLRPAFVRGGLERALVAKLPTDAIHTPTVFAPQRGPRAPWTLGIEEGDPNLSDVSLLNKNTRQADASATSADLCADSSAQRASDSKAPKLHPLVDYLCGRREDQARYGKEQFFRKR